MARWEETLLAAPAQLVQPAPLQCLETLQTTGEVQDITPRNKLHSNNRSMNNSKLDGRLIHGHSQDISKATNPGRGCMMIPPNLTSQLVLRVWAVLEALEGLWDGVCLPMLGISLRSQLHRLNRRVLHPQMLLPAPEMLEGQVLTIVEEAVEPTEASIPIPAVEFDTLLLSMP